MYTQVLFQVYLLVVLNLLRCFASISIITSNQVEEFVDKVHAIFFELVLTTYSYRLYALKVAWICVEDYC